MRGAFRRPSGESINADLSHADFARFLDVARASLAECQNHLVDAVDRDYLDAGEFERLNRLSERAAAAVARLQRYLRGPH